MKHVLKGALSKISCIVAALVLALTMVPANAFAAPTSPRDVADSKVTITDLLEGDKVEAYQIADADIDSANNLTYTMASHLPADYDTIDELKGIVSDGQSFTQGTAMQKAASAIAKSFSDANVAATATATAAGGKAELTLGSGYYLIRITSTSGKTRVYQNMIVDVSPKAKTNGTGYDPADAQSLPVKKTEVGITKGVGDDYKPSTDKYSVGDMVPFQVKTAIPNYPADSKTATFEINDTPSAGLEIDTSTIAVDGAAASDYTLTASATGYKIAFKKEFVLANPGKAITVTYKAKLTKDAFFKSADDATGNTATVKFNPNPYTDGTSEPDSKTKVYTYGYVFKKVTPDNQPLKGAEFTLTNKATGKSVKAVSDDNGYVTFTGLAAGDYTVSETGVPAGYSKIADWDITISKDTAKGDNPATPATEVNFLVEQQDKVDPKQPALPVTGDAGTFGLTAAGTALLAAGVFFVVRSRKQQA
ncbi:isopeptide-forming domain-containing fimbrial protein [Lancefieldella rimae]|uniref:isopeptide-forming domain-containing fimbrial protein n=1 Tax=Lancefieldella rimae TaxID=1383 RepID=UPI0028F0FDD0|nr:isopeptide-forming domain-containing fimbrial protein [Lancefieldella rimae]